MIIKRNLLQKFEKLQNVSVPNALNVTIKTIVGIFR